MEHVAEKLEALGDRLSYPHQSAIRGAENLRELRPRGGRSPNRAFYRRMGRDLFVIAGIGPEAAVNPRLFERAVAAATQRLAALTRGDP